MADNGNNAAIGFAAIQLSRVAGIVLLFVGAMIVLERIEAPGFLGIGLVLVGMAVFFALPLVFARLFRSPPR